MRIPKSDKEPESAHSKALKRRMVDMREVLGMRHMLPIALDIEEKPEELKAALTLSSQPSLAASSRV
jgi:hypothetical protein